MRTRQRQRNARICTIQRMCTFTNAAQASHPYCADLGVPCIHIKYVATIICQATSFCKTCLSWHEQCDHFLSYLHMKMLLEAVDIVWILSTGTVRLRQCSPQKDLSQTDLQRLLWQQGPGRPPPSCLSVPASVSWQQSAAGCWSRLQLRGQIFVAWLWLARCWLLERVWERGEGRG